MIHLGCGLDSRVFRLDPGPGVEWYDVDYPAVIALREKLFPSPTAIPPGCHSGDRSVLARPRFPADRPTLLLAEGISMYLTEDDGIALLQHVVDRFGSGELQIDFYSWLIVRSQKTHRLQRQSGSTLYWAVNSPADIARPSFRGPIAGRHNVFRREHIRPDIGRSSGWRGSWSVRSRRCAEHSNTTATPSAPLTDTACGVLFGDGCPAANVLPQSTFPAQAHASGTRRSTVRRISG